MQITYLSPSHHVHMLAVIGAGIRPRVVLLFPKVPGEPVTEIVATFVCPRKRGCRACAWELGDTLRVNVGLVQRGSPVEMQRVAGVESPAPTAADVFPQATGP